MKDAHPDIKEHVRRADKPKAGTVGVPPMARQALKRQAKKPAKWNDARNNRLKKWRS